MPDCSEYSEWIQRVERLIEATEQHCAGETDPREQKACVHELAVLREEKKRAQQALASCQTGLPRAGVQTAQGRITWLRVHDLGSGYGPKSDFLDAECVFGLDTQPRRAFGFALKPGGGLAAHEGMLALAQNALTHDLDVSIDYQQVVNHFNAIVFRLAVVRPAF